MSNAHVQILGSNSALPANGRKPSAHHVVFNKDQFLVDCGEGTQFTIQELGIRKSKYNHIFITHLHGDHLFGLPGLVTSYQLGGRETKLTIYGPAPLKEYLKFNIEGVGHHVSFPIEIVELDPKNPGTIFENSNVKVSCFSLDHRIPCVGYRFDEKPKRRNINKDLVEKYNLNVAQIKMLLNKQDITLESGLELSYEECLMPKKPTTSFAYCSDTKYNESILPYIKGVKVLYHESTYLHELETIASERFHATTVQAATMAKKAEASKLILGHYSSRYKDIGVFKAEAETIFDNVELAVEGKIIPL